MTARAAERARKAIAATLVVGGAWGGVLVAKLVGLLRQQWATAVVTGQRGVVLGNGAILCGFAALVSAALIGGALLWKGKRLGQRLSEVVLGAQLLFVAVPGFQYKIALLGFLGFGVTGSRVGLLFASDTCMFVEFDPDELWAFVVNIPALAMLLILMRLPLHIAGPHVEEPLVGPTTTPG